MDPSKSSVDLGAVGIPVGVLVGPVGIVLGILGLRRADSSTSRRLARVAIAVGVVQTLLLGALVWGLASGNFGAGAMRASGVPSAIVVGGETVTPTFSPRPSPVYTPPTTPADPAQPLAPATVPGGFTAENVRPDPDTVADGAVDAVTATYSGPRENIELRQSAWGTPEEAEQHAEAVRGDSTGLLVKTGTVGVPPEGNYWYYDENGQSTMVWTQGTIVGIATGPADDLQMFYLGIIARP